MTTAEIITLAPFGVNQTSVATSINNSGTTVVSIISNGPGATYLVENGFATALSPGGGQAINDWNEVVGTALGASSQITEWYAGFSYNLISNGASGSGNAIDDNGDVAGGVYVTTANATEAFAIIKSSVHYLGTLNNVVSTTTVSSQANGINVSGQVVGDSLYQTGSQWDHAFLWVNGTMTDLGTLSGGDFSDATAINANGVIAGWSNAAAGSAARTAVTWTDNVISALATPTGYTSTFALALNDSSQVVGWGLDQRNQERALLWQNGTVTDLNSLLPANSPWFLQEATGINDQGLIVGFGLYNGQQTAFEMTTDAIATPLHTAQAVLQLLQQDGTAPAQTVIDSAENISLDIDLLQTPAVNGKITSIAFSDSGTPQLDISALQFIEDAAAVAKMTGSFSVLLSAAAPNLTLTGLTGHATTIQFFNPASDYSVAAIDGGTGFTVTDTGTGRSSTDTFHNVKELSFSDGTKVFAEAAGVVTIANVGSLTGGYAKPYSLNDQGQAAGYAGTTSLPLQQQGFLWSNGQLVSLQPLSGASGVEATHINNQGQIVGESYLGNSLGSGSSTAVAWYATGQSGATSLSPVSLGWLPGDFASIANANNDLGQVVGVSYTTGTTYQGFLWQNGAMTALGSLGGPQVQPNAINDSGQIVGRATNAGGVFHAFLWQNGAMTDLGVPTGSATGSATGINSSGLVVGYGTDSAGAYHAVEWSGGQAAFLSPLSGGTSCFANGLNDQGWIVGESNVSNGNVAAVIWYDGLVINLNTFLPANSGWIMGDATSVNNEGQISGLGTYNGTTASFVITLPGITFTAAQAEAAYKTGQFTSAVTISDSAVDINAALDGLVPAVGTGHVAGITLTDGGIPTLTVGGAQLVSDASVLKAITSYYSLDVTMSSSSQSLTAISGHAATAVFSGDASAYTIASSGGAVTVTQGAVTETLTGFTALQFADHTEIVAAAPGSSTVTTGNITELYGAVFGREPDVAGLAYYQAELTANPSTPLISFAQSFLASPEYTGNSAHAYQQNAAGDAQFITDLYQNLLHRAPGTGDVAWYQANVINPLIGTAAAGSAAYAQANSLARAQLIVDVSASAEFLGNVQVTGTHPADLQHWLVVT